MNTPNANSDQLPVSSDQETRTDIAAEIAALQWERESVLHSIWAVRGERKPGWVRHAYALDARVKEIDTIIAFAEALQAEETTT